MRTPKVVPLPENGLSRLLSMCRWGCRFYSEAAEVSRRKKQSQAMLFLELQRANLANELQAWVEPGSWSQSTLLPQVRAARHDDEQILQLCDHLDAETISAYSAHLATLAPGLERTLLERHLFVLTEGRNRRLALQNDGD